MRRTALILTAVTALGTATTAWSLAYRLPAEAVPAALSQPDAEAVVANCSGCHSLDYLTTQPRGKGAQFWRDSVKKMITVYGAPIPPEEVDPLTAVLAARLD